MEKDAKSENPEPAPKRGAARFIFPILFLIAVIAIGAYYLTRPASESTDDASIEAHVAMLASQVAAQVESVEAQDNQMVKKGDLLVSLDPRDYRTRVAQTRAQWESAVAKLQAARAKSGVTRRSSFNTERSARSEINVSQAEVMRDQAAVETANVGKSAARDRWLAAKSEVDTARRDLAQVRAAADVNRVDEGRTQRDLLRYQNLYSQKAIAAQQLDNARAAHDTALANLRTALEKVRVSASQLLEKIANENVAFQNWRQSDSQIKEAQAHVQQANSQVEDARLKSESLQTAPEQFAQAKADTHAAQADVMLAKSNYEQALLNLSYCQIHAPIDGRVARRTVEPGNFVSAGQALLSVVSRERWAIANFKETQLTKMRPGQRVKLEIDAFPNLDLQGVVDSFQSGTGARFSLLPPENASGNWVKVVQRVPVKIVFEHQAPQDIDLAPGMSVTATVDLAGAHERRQ